VTVPDSRRAARVRIGRQRNQPLPEAVCERSKERGNRCWEPVSRSSARSFIAGGLAVSLFGTPPGRPRAERHEPSRAGGRAFGRRDRSRPQAARRAARRPGCGRPRRPMHSGVASGCGLALPEGRAPTSSSKLMRGTLARLAVGAHPAIATRPEPNVSVSRAAPAAAAAMSLLMRRRHRALTSSPTSTR
jgi:hypothetical protein